MVAFVAEVSGNHLGSLDRAIAIIDAARESGATHVKFQTYEPHQMCDPNVIVQSGPWSGRNLHGLYLESYTPKEWHKALFDRARKLNIVPFSSVFHVNDVDFLEKIGCEIFKISSFEILDLPLIRHAAATKKPLIISCGMATEKEIGEAVIAAAGSGCRDLTLLKCTSVYPAEVSDTNLKAMRHLYPSGWWWTCEGNWKYGLSDHTLGLGAAVASVVKGGVMIEKHLCLSRADGGPDSGFSSEPAEFAAMVKACHEAAAALGEVRYGPTESEMSSLPLRRKPGGKRGG